jgi:hypothetical protein
MLLKSEVTFHGLVDVHIRGESGECRALARYIKRTNKSMLTICNPEPCACLVLTDRMEGKTLLAVRVLGWRWRSRCEGLLFMSLLLRPPSGVYDIPDDERMGQLPVNKLTEDPELEQRVSSQHFGIGKNGQSTLTSQLAYQNPPSTSFKGFLCRCVTSSQNTPRSP